MHLRCGREAGMAAKSLHHLGRSWIALTHGAYQLSEPLARHGQIIHAWLLLPLAVGAKWAEAMMESIPWMIGSPVATR